MIFSNPRKEASFADWPLGGGRRGECKFTIEHKPGKGYRVVRQTFGKPKCNTFGGEAVIVDGDDGRTYILQKMNHYEGVNVIQSDFHSCTIFPENPEYASLVAIIDSVYKS